MFYSDNLRSETEMDHSVVLKDDIRNAILAAQRVAVELGRRVPTSAEMDVFLDGFATALDVIATSFGVQVAIERPFADQPRRWQEVWDALPAFTVGDETETKQRDRQASLLTRKGESAR